ncbi:MAG: SEC-C metal-binding domain-containing protein, partial [Gemmatimonadota bacterium]|nr:SEC-C metal-binding domain-containing protein [Gemmatimonadota bacterium]
MKIGRNDPCPCGSGKKYKHCCQEKDLAEEEELALGELASEAFQALLASGIEEVSWQVALVPLGIQVEDDRNARPAVLLVAMGPVPLHVDLVSDPPAEPAEVAALLAQGIRSAADQAGGLPSRIEVRDPEIARLLTEAFASHEVAVDASPSLDALDHLA